MMKAIDYVTERTREAIVAQADQYQGWHNYQTWAVNLWLTNDEAHYMRLREILEFYNETPHGNRMAAECLLTWVEETNPLSNPHDASMFSDILTYALAQVDYLEIVKANREE